jgi:hypothetical protein
VAADAPELSAALGLGARSIVVLVSTEAITANPLPNGAGASS